MFSYLLRLFLVISGCMSPELKNILLVFSVTIVSLLGLSPITPDFPQILKYFRISPQQVGLLITLFALSGVVLTPFYGIMADRIGRRKVLIFSLILYGISGTACAFANSFNWLLILRFFQGMGAAGLGVLSVTIIGDLFIEPQRTKIFGYNAGILSIGTIILPILGGGLAQLSWRYPFLLNLMSLIVAYFVYRYMELTPISRNNTLSFKTYINRVIIRLHSFDIIWLIILNSISLLLIMGPYLNYYPILLSKKFHLYSWQIGLLMSVASIGSAIASISIGVLTRKLNLKWLISSAFAGYMISFFLFGLLNQVLLIAIPSFIFGLSNGIIMPLITGLLAGHTSDEFRGAIMSFNGMVFRIVQVIGPVVAATFYTFWGFSGVFYGTTIFSAIFFILTLFISAGLNPQTDKQTNSFIPE